MDEKKSFWKRSDITTKKKVAFIVMLLWGISGCVTWMSAGWLFMRFAGNGGVSGAATVAVKDFEPLGMVFVSAAAKSGNGTDAYNLLLKEAQKLGADSITNVRINRQ
jgi:hypothetical protein